MKTNARQHTREQRTPALEALDILFSDEGAPPPPAPVQRTPVQEQAPPAGTYDWENAGPARFGRGLEALLTAMGAIFLLVLGPILWLLGAGFRQGLHSQPDSSHDSLHDIHYVNDDSPSPDGTGFSWVGNQFVMHSDYGR